jgi:adenylylsulfate kinase-like enzyme
MVIWIIGLSGSGKTFLSKNLLKSLKKKFKKIKWIDGDQFRKKFSKDLGYSLKDRKKNSNRMRRYCKQYEEKKYIVICSILSVFRDHQRSNRKFFKEYIQVFIQVNSSLLIKRNSKKIYSFNKNIVGKNINFPKPYKSDITINNNFKKSFLKSNKLIIDKIYEKVSNKNFKSYKK